MPVLAQDLRDAVLQAAIEGKLTEQLESDSSVDKLLNDIATEKERLVKEKIIKKEKKLAPITEDEIPFEIPSSWRWVQQGKLSYVISDGTHKTPKYVSNGIPFLSVKDISKGYFDLTNVKYITEEEHNKLCERVKPQKNDILFCRIGTLGKAIKVTLNFDFDIFVSLGLIRYSTNINPDYMVYYLNSPSTYQWIDKVKVGGGTHTNKINLIDLPNLIIPLPPIEEQQRIVDKLNEIMPLIDEYEKLENQLVELKKKFPEDMKAAILQAAMEGKLTEQLESDSSVDELLKSIQQEKELLIKEKKIKKEKPLAPISDDEIPFDIPNSWRWVNLYKICKSISAGGDKPKNFSKTLTEQLTIPVYANGEINDGLFGYTDLPVIKEQAITVSGRGTIGFSRIRTANFVPIVRLLVITLLDNTVNINYLCLVLNALLENGQGTAVKQLTVPMISPKLIPLPPIEEQQRIVEKLEQLLPLIDELKGV